VKDVDMSANARSADSIFAHAIEIESPADRAVFLEDACGAEGELRQEVEELVRNHFRAGDFMERPAAALAATVVQAMAERPGTVIGPYKLMEQLGEGGMGLVFVAEQERPVRRKVALKVIKPGMDTRQVVARFEAERQALALMDHPNIARVLDGGETESGRPYFVMELVKGVPVTEYCDQQQLSIRERLALFVDVCAAVQHAHQKGVIHRDLKPSNVLVVPHDGRPVVKVIDFGVAKAVGQRLTDKTVYTHFAQMIGTPLYMAPEQAGESGLDVDTRSDIYTLGVLLYELLTGTTPFDKDRLKAAGYDEMRRIIREEEPPRPSTRISTVGQLATTLSMQRKSDPKKLRQLLRGELDWIVMKALEKDRNRRYETASAFAADVQRYLADEPVQACPPSAWYRFRKFAQRNKARLGIVALAAASLALLGAAGLWWAQQRATAGDEARAALAEATGLLEKEQWPESLRAARHAEAVVAGVGAYSDLGRQARELIRDVEMAARLHEARLQKTAVKEGHFDSEALDAAYATAFAEYGLDVDGLEPRAAAEQIHVRPIRQHLVAALDEWASVRRTLGRAGWRHRLATARAADRDVWRNRLRDAVEANNPKGFEEAAAAQAASDWPVTTITLVGTLAETAPSGERVAAVLVRAQRRHPGDFWINETLGLILMNARPRRVHDAVRYFTAAVALQPQSPGAHFNLGSALKREGRTDEAIAEYREAVRIKQDYAAAHCLIGSISREKGALDDAIEAFRAAIRISDTPLTRIDLGSCLCDNGQLDDAIEQYQAALRSKRPFAEDYAAHYGIGYALVRKGRLDDAIREYREALRIKWDYADGHNALGRALADKDQLDNAITEFLLAIRLDKHLAIAHCNLGLAFCCKHRLDDAMAEFQDAIRAKPDYADAYAGRAVALLKKGRVDDAIADYRVSMGLGKASPEQLYNLGGAFYDKSRWEEAIVAFRETLRLRPLYAEAHCNLGLALKWHGDFRQALEELRRGHELGSKNARWSYPSVRWVRECEHLVRLEGRLSSCLAGTTIPTSPSERAELAGLCMFKQLNRAAARFYEEAFAGQPELADAMGGRHLFNAACVAALAAAGQGKDAGNLDSKECGRLRRQALAWLRAELGKRNRQVENGSADVRTQALRALAYWQQADDLVSVRTATALAKLPADEQRGWRQLWADVGKTLASVRHENKRQEKSALK
jgi:serine/threonine protein kinase/Tfp pilus assembly protein PilF